ncbi:MAG: hypothetical protein H7276_18760 [Caulobacter sp.]|nr:hypothetical protein [Vitreoscilla sp.]
MIARREKLLRAGMFGLLICWGMFAGKDVSWDVVNHHLYLPFSWVTGRFRTDLFAAGAQSYQNPLGYFPIYALVSLGLPAWIIGLLLSALHASVVWPLDRIARLFWPGDREEDFWCRALALAFGCIAPILLIHEGTTSSDPITALMILWAVALSLELSAARAAPSGNRRDAAIAGALLGLAAAVKLSNAVFVLALCLLWLMKWAFRQADLARVALFAAGLTLAFAIGAGPWMAWLQHDFGNPIFPLFNNVFHSPDAPQQPFTSLRFVPATPGGMVSRVWEMATFSSFVVFEDFLPDIRPALMALAALAAALALGLRGGWRRLAQRETWCGPGVRYALLVVAMYVLWIRSSGNARYALPLFVLVGVGLVRATQHVVPFRTLKVLLLAALVIQGANYLALGAWRFSGVGWDAGPYLDYRVSKRLQEQPFLHLSVGTQTNAAIALFLAPGGALAHPVGGFSLPTDGPLGVRLASLMDRWHGRTRLLFAAPTAVTPAEVSHAREELGALVYRLGVDTDWSDCETVQFVPTRGSWRPLGQADEKTGREKDLLSCAVRYLSRKDSAAEVERVTAEKVFEILEAACPTVFSPRPMASEHSVGVWQRHYLNTEAELSVSTSQGVNFTHFRVFPGVYFGSIDDVLARRKPVACPRINYQTPQ